MSALSFKKYIYILYTYWEHELWSIFESTVTLYM